MSPQHIFATALRLFAISLAFWSIPYFVQLLGQPVIIREFPGGSWKLAAAYIVGAMMVLVAVSSWYFPMRLAHALLPHGRFADRPRPQLHEAVRLGCALLGLWLLHDMFPSLLRLSSWVFYAPIFGGRAPAVVIQREGSQLFAQMGNAGFLVFGVQMLLALALLFGGGLFARLVARERTA